MARFFSGVKIMSALVSDGLFRNARFIRRGYAAAGAAERVVSGTAADGVAARSGSTTKKKETERSGTEKAAWVPHPVTGYYRPENCADEIDPVDLRAMHKNSRFI